MYSLHASSEASSAGRGGPTLAEGDGMLEGYVLGGRDMRQAEVAEREEYMVGQNFYKV